MFGGFVWNNNPIESKIFRKISITNSGKMVAYFYIIILCQLHYNVSL